MNIGFDPGCHELRVLFRRGQTLVARHCRSAYIVLPDQSAHREMLTQLRLPFGKCDNHLVLLGDAISSLALNLRVPTRPLFPSGRLDMRDPLTQEILVAELEALVPPSPGPESLCGISMPHLLGGASVDAFSATHNSLINWVRQRGYTPLQISPARALVLAELSDTEFTGLSVSFGSAFCNYSLCVRGEELVSGHVARGGQWIEEQFAEQSGLYCLDTEGRQWPDTERAAVWIASEGCSIAAPQTDASAFLQSLYRDLAREVYLQLFDDLFDASLPRPLPAMTLLISGGVSRINGFSELISELWLRPGLPLEIEQILIADDSPYTIARGCLIFAGMSSAAEKSAA